MNRKHAGDRAFALHLAVTAAAFAPLLREHFAVDTYYVYRYPALNAPWVAACGRSVAAAAEKLLAALGIVSAREQWLSIAVLILVSAGCSAAIAVRLLSRMEKATSATKTLVHVACLVGTVNVLTEEWYAFPESAITLYALSLLFAVLAALQTEKGGVKNCLTAVLFLALGTNAYQSALGLYTMLSVLLLTARSQLRCEKTALRGVLFTLCNAAGNALFNVLLGMALGALGVIGEANTRLAISAAGFIHNILSVGHTQLLLWNDAYGLLPVGTAALALLLSLGLLAAALHRAGCAKRDIWFVLLGAAGAYAFVFAPLLFTERVWPAQRSVAAAWLLLSMAGVYLASLGAGKKPTCALGAVLTAFLLLNIVCIFGIERDTFAVNRAERAEAESIQRVIDEYEAAGNPRVEYISLVPDADSPESYPFVRYAAYDLNSRALRSRYGGLSLLETVSGRRYTWTDMPDSVYETYFTGKNWNTLTPEEQLVFDGNTLYMAVW